MAEIIADDGSTDDRRQVVNSGVQRGRDAVLAEISALADIGGQITTSDVIATRGEQLASVIRQYSGSDERAACNVGGLEVLETRYRRAPAGASRIRPRRDRRRIRRTERPVPHG